MSDRKTRDSVLQAMNMLGEKQDHKVEAFEPTPSMKKDGPGLGQTSQHLY